MRTKTIVKRSLGSISRVLYLSLLLSNIGRTQNYTLKLIFSFRSQNLLLSAIDEIIPKLILENPELTMSKPNTYPIHARVDSPKSGIAEIAHL